MRLRYLQAFTDKATGGAYHYFRRPGFKRTRLPGLPGSPEFMRAYEAALAGAPVEIGAAKRSKPGSLSAAVAGYYSSLDFRSLSAGTQRMERSVLERLRNKYGDFPLAGMPDKFIRKMLDTLKPH